MLAFTVLLLTASLATAAPSRRSLYPSMPNNTCVTAPSTSIDKDWIANAPLTASIVGGQPGVSMLLDIGVMDTTTCQPIQDVLVEVWSTNAVGEYGENFLRGATTTGSNGIAEFNTIFPGHTTGSANHINVIVHNKGATTTEGATTAAFTGELFFTDPWTDIINKWQMYAANPNPRTINANDPEFQVASANGMNPVADIEEIQDDWPEGIVAYLTIGIDPTAAPQPLV